MSSNIFNITCKDEYEAFLDTNVLIDLHECTYGGWTPKSIQGLPTNLTKTEAQKVAAAMILHYRQTDKEKWHLVLCEESALELSEGRTGDWTDCILMNTSDAPGGISEAELDLYIFKLWHEMPKFRRQKHHNDGLILINALLRPTAKYLITNDRALKNAASRLNLENNLTVLTTIEAAELLDLREPAYAPLKGSPGITSHWWTQPEIHQRVLNFG